MTEEDTESYNEAETFSEEDRSESYFPGVPRRDVAMTQRVARDLTRLSHALQSGDGDTVREVFPHLRKLSREAERIRRVARRAMRR